MKRWISAHRVALGVVTIIVLVLGGGGYVTWTAVRQSGATPNAAAPSRGDLMFVDLADGQNLVSTVRLDRPDGDRTATSLRCQRVYRSAGTTVCLRLAGLGPSYEVQVLNSSGAVVRTVAMAGTPSRARVSASGNVVSWTSFVTGDSYLAPGGFSTRTGVLDLRSGEVTESLETFAATINNQPLVAADINYWGVTVASDDRTFYATLASGGRTWLVRGDLTTKTVRGVRQNAECPSLSPDGTKVAYKKRVNRVEPWALAVLDLGSGQERILPDTTGIDDQAVWLDNAKLAYGSTHGQQRTGIFLVPEDGSAGGRLLIPGAASPVPIG